MVHHTNTPLMEKNKFSKVVSFKLYDKNFFSVT